jgi:hypothetical protein
VRRETASAYVKATGIVVRLPRFWGKRIPAKPAREVTPDFIAPFSMTPSIRSACEAHRERIEQGLALGRNGKAIWQDLVSDHGFAGDFHDRSLSRGQKLSRRATEERGCKFLVILRRVCWPLGRGPRPIHSNLPGTTPFLRLTTMDDCLRGAVERSDYFPVCAGALLVKKADAPHENLPARIGTEVVEHGQGQFDDAKYTFLVSSVEPLKRG